MVTVYRSADGGSQLSMIAMGCLRIAELMVHHLHDVSIAVAGILQKPKKGHRKMGPKARGMNHPTVQADAGWKIHDRLTSIIERMMHGLVVAAS